LSAPAARRPPRVWLFDLDDTLHDAASASMPGLHVAMNAYIERHLGLPPEAASALRRRYWQRYGATLLGLVRHHAVRPAHFLEETHRLPGLEAAVRGHRADLAALARLPGRRVLLTNAPAAYAERVLAALGCRHLFHDVIAVEQMVMFGQWRPKPDARMLTALAARLRVAPSRCVLVEDSPGNLQGARRAGWRTVWMQRWLHAHHRARPARPPGVQRLVRRLADLRRIIPG
jgi:putative hydrolase of the HAD superfamily